MAGELILFPVRIYLRAARFAVRTGVHATEQALTLAAQVVRSVTPDPSAEDAERPAPTRAAAPAEARIATPPPSRKAEAPAEAPLPRPTATPWPPARPPAPAADVAPDDPPAPHAPPAPDAPPAPEAPPLRAEPVHVSEEPTVVGEFAEPGAENGAGAEVNVAEPWEGYSRMSAKDVISRLADAAPAELAAIQLYEGTHKHRETVIAATTRELRSKSGRGAATADQPRKEQPNG